MLIDFARELVDLELILKSYGYDPRTGDGIERVKAEDLTHVRMCRDEYSAMVRATGYTLGHIYYAGFGPAADAWHNVCTNIKETVRVVCLTWDNSNVDQAKRAELWLACERFLNELRAA